MGLADLLAKIIRSGTVTIWNKTRFPGVRFKEPGTRRLKGRVEKYFSIRYRRSGKLVEEGVGWESAGITPQFCSNLRTNIISNIRTGQGFQSLREKREVEEADRRAKEAAKEVSEREKTPFDALANKFLEWSMHNKKSWKADESRYRTHIKPVLGHIPIKDIGIIQLEGLKKKLRAKGIAPQTILHCLQLIRAMYNRAAGWKLYNGPNPVQETAKTDKGFLRIPDSSRLRFLSHKEADILLEELKQRSSQLHDIALISLHTGARAGEIFSLTWADIDLQHKIITLRDTKNNETRQAYMTPQLEGMLTKRRPQTYRKTGLIFTNRNGEKIREVSNAFERTVQKIGFNKDIADPRDKLVFHSLRHTHGSWLALQGTPIFTIKELMGHRKIEMTMRYSHLLPDQKRAAVLQLADAHAKVVPLEKKQGKKK